MCWKNTAIVIYATYVSVHKRIEPVEPFETESASELHGIDTFLNQLFQC